MARKSIRAFLILLLAGNLPLAAQDARRLAVIPFNFLNEDPQEVEIVYSAFQAALGRTGAYSVIGREEITAALESRGLGLFDCTSEQCAADLALRLSANQWVRGVLAGTAGSHTLKVKVVEVASGRALYLDTLSSPSLEQMLQSLELFAFKLAGLTLSSGKEVRIAGEFGDVLVETVPAKADIFVNGVKKGIGPDLIRRVPLGRVRIAAQLGSLYGEKVVDVTRSLQMVLIELAESPSSLRLLASGSLLDVYLDGTRLGPLGDGNFTALVPGVHTLELQGQGLYWREEVALRANEQTTVTAQVRAFGTIEYEIPPGTVAEIQGEHLREAVTGIGLLQAPAGEYSAAISGRDYEKLEGLAFSVTKESTISFRPDLKYSRTYELAQFTRHIEEAERALIYGYRLTSDDILRLKEVQQAIARSKYEFSELASRMELLIARAEAILAAESADASAGGTPQQQKERELKELLARKQQLELQIEGRRLQGRRKAAGGWISFGAGLASGAAAGVFYYLSDAAYQAYLRASTWPEAQQKMNEVKLWDISTIAALSASGVGLVVSSVLWFSGANTRQLRRELQEIEKQIEILQM